MKRLSSVKKLKRLNILHRPVATQDLKKAIDIEAFNDTWLLEVEKLETKRLRYFRHLLAS